jgi:hypothetical protein
MLNVIKLRNMHTMLGVNNGALHVIHNVLKLALGEAILNCVMTHHRLDFVVCDTTNTATDDLTL